MFILFVHFRSNAFAFSECTCWMVFHHVCGVPPAAPALAAVLFLCDGRQHPPRPWEPCEVPRETCHEFPTLVRHAVAMHANYGNFTICQSHGVARKSVRNCNKCCQRWSLKRDKLESRAMIEANISRGSNTGNRKVVVDSIAVLRDRPALACIGNVSNPLGTCVFTLFEQLLGLDGC